VGVCPWLSCTIQDYPLEHLCPSLAGLHFPGDNREPQTARPQPWSSHSERWLVYTGRKLKHGMYPCSPVHTWTLTFWVGPYKVFPMY
jgi:hypothetical protein